MRVQADNPTIDRVSRSLFIEDLIICCNVKHSYDGLIKQIKVASPDIEIYNIS